MQNITMWEAFYRFELWFSSFDIITGIFFWSMMLKMFTWFVATRAACWEVPRNFSSLTFVWFFSHSLTFIFYPNSGSCDTFSYIHYSKPDSSFISSSVICFKHWLLPHSAASLSSCLELFCNNNKNLSLLPRFEFSIFSVLYTRALRENCEISLCARVGLCTTYSSFFHFNKLIESEGCCAPFRNDLGLECCCWTLS